MPNRLVLLGVDAASPDLIRAWVDAGKLPNLKSLVDEGVSGRVAGVEGLFIGSTWPSFYTGLHPGRHGIYRIEQLESGTYGFFRPFEIPDGVGGTPFWRLASDEGRRVAVLDVPLSRIEPELNGIQTVEWGGHDAVFGFRTSPPELAGEILAGAGPYPLPQSCDGRRESAADFEAFIDGLERAVAVKAELTLAAMAREEWDLVVQVFTEAHCAGHQCWHLHDPAHPSHDPQIREAVGDPLERVYRAVDAAVGAILERTGDARILLFSAHGMGSSRGAHFLLPEILRRLGASVGRTASAPSRGSVRSALRGAARRVLPPGVRDLLRASRRWLARPGAKRADPIPWDLEKSRCFPIPIGFPVAGIRLNLVGREPTGVLRPGADADAFCSELAAALLEIVDERSGEPLIQRVLRTEDLYDGTRRHALPDLLLEWNDRPVGTMVHAKGRGASVAAASTRIGRVEGTNRWGRTGEHVPEGFFVFRGAGVPAGRREAPVPVMDFHPTICRLLGLPDPDVDGRVIPELVQRRGPEA